MSVFMRAMLSKWPVAEFDELVVWCTERGLRVISPGARGWKEWELRDDAGEAVLEGDTYLELDAGEEVAELLEHLEDHHGPQAARSLVEARLGDVAAIVALRVLMSNYDASVAAANVVIDFLEHHDSVLTQVDTVGWYVGDDLVLSDDA